MSFEMLKNLPFKPSRLSKNLPGLFAFLLLLIVLVSLLGIIFVQQKVRHLETDYANLLRIQEKQHQVWGRLILEKNHLSSPVRVKRIAKAQLGMHLRSNVQTQQQLIKLSVSPVAKGHE